MMALFGGFGDADLYPAGIAFEQGQRRRQVMGNAGDEFLAVLLILFLGQAGRAQLAAHVVEGFAGPAELIAR